MERRKGPRYKRRIQIDFWSEDDRNPRKGFTQNLSLNGLFVATNAPFKPGTRVFLEIPSGNDQLLLRGEVRYSARVDPALQKVKPSGMGVRLLPVEELMSELLKLKQTAAETVSSSKEIDLAEADAEPEPKGPLFPVTYQTQRDLVRSYERDIKYGGLFVPAQEPAMKDETVVIEFRFGWDDLRTVRVEATVVKKFAAAEGSIAGEAVSGMGVAFVDPKDVTRQFEQIFATLDESGGTGG